MICGLAGEFWEWKSTYPKNRRGWETVLWDKKSTDRKNSSIYSRLNKIIQIKFYPLLIHIQSSKGLGQVSEMMQNKECCPIRFVVACMDGNLGTQLIPLLCLKELINLGSNSVWWWDSDYLFGSVDTSILWLQKWEKTILDNTSFQCRIPPATYCIWRKREIIWIPTIIFKWPGTSEANYASIAVHSHISFDTHWALGGLKHAAGNQETKEWETFPPEWP